VPQPGFLLNFAHDRDDYRAKLREHLPDFEAALMSYQVSLSVLICWSELSVETKVRSRVARASGCS
jgi:hypothetical protein